MSRPTCSQCAQPQVRCICPWVQPVKNRVPVLILQHPKEAGSAKNTARLLHLSLTNIALNVYETLCPPRLMWLLVDRKTNVLPCLYSAEPTLLKARALEPVLDPISAPGMNNLRLVMFDASWRKSRKMLYLNPMLQQ